MKTQTYTKPRYVCFDCGESTGSPMLVYRLMGPVGEQYSGTTFVHRGGQGCHKGETSSQVRDVR